MNEIGHSRKYESPFYFDGLGDANMRRKAVSKNLVPHIQSAWYMNRNLFNFYSKQDTKLDENPIQ